MDVATLAEALRASWDEKTAYRGVVRVGNSAYGQCYPTSRVVRWFYPAFEIAKGEVWTPTGIEQHFWNARADGTEWLDLSWEQFPAGSRVLHYVLLDRHALGDSDPTVARCALLLERVQSYLSRRSVRA
ncbi:YunG family protein [Sphingomonas azotifigens]|uniref:YunG family protein n=1 Tax=Sphingomonas azotifigens TaxID=330920 RepID=UPI001C3FA318|nr:hypothetical protein [Sphingomonas azotifigens]